MEESFYQKVKENEEKIKFYGPHVTGLVNLTCNIGLYPFFQLSTQLSLSQQPGPNYSGKSLKEKMFSYVFNHHEGNRPYRPPKFHNYTAAFIHNSLQGPLAFYKGFSASVLSFYFSILCKSLSSYVVQEKIGTFSKDYLLFAGILYLEILLSSGFELLLHPLFVIQTRLINQNRHLKVFSGYKDVYLKCGFKSLWAGWGSILPRQALISIWAAYSMQVDRNLELILGSSNFAQVFLREIFVGAGGMLLGYPLLTLGRRVAACGEVVGMSRDGFKGVGKAGWSIIRNEGMRSLFRGFGCYCFTISVWILFMPTLTQLFWLKFGPDREDFLNG